MRRPFAALALVALAAVSGACGGLIDDQAAKSTFKILEASQVAARRLPDVELAKAAMPGGIIQLEAFAIAYPKHSGFRRLHADSICQYALSFVFDDWEDASLTGKTDVAAQTAARLQTLLETCADKQLALLPAAWRAARAQGAAAWTALLPRAKREQASPLLWVASSDGVRIALAPMTALVLLKPTIATLERVIAIAPRFHDSDAELMLASIQAGASRMLGGPDGTALFAAARKALGEGALMPLVLEARAVAVAKADRAQLTTTLEHVLAEDVSRTPDRRLANELARRKARRYLAAIDVLIPPAN